MTPTILGPFSGEDHTKAQGPDLPSKLGLGLFFPKLSCLGLTVKEAWEGLEAKVALRVWFWNMSFAHVTSLKSLVGKLPQAR